MKKYVVKRKTAGLCAVICAGMLLSAGCAGSDANTQAKPGQQKCPATWRMNLSRISV